ncbi:hypothetical protein FB451DRAFT_191288 [Mycena latifolia]|nr:hypothetical protein FB451DRAFT_191288 [Mycena latifolia]
MAHYNTSARPQSLGYMPHEPYIRCIPTRHQSPQATSLVGEVPVHPPYPRIRRVPPSPALRLLRGGAALLVSELVFGWMTPLLVCGPRMQLMLDTLGTIVLASDVGARHPPLGAPAANTAYARHVEHNLGRHVLALGVRARQPPLGTPAHAQAPAPAAVPKALLAPGLPHASPHSCSSSRRWRCDGVARRDPLHHRLLRLVHTDPTPRGRGLGARGRVAPHLRDRRVVHARTRGEPRFDHAARLPLQDRLPQGTAA